GLSPRLFGMITSAVFGKFWKAQVARELMLHHQTIRRWGRGERQIPLWIERHLLALLLSRARKTHFLVRTAYRRAEAAHRAKQELEKMPRFNPLSRPHPPRAEF